MKQLKQFIKNKFPLAVYYLHTYPQKKFFTYALERKAEKGELTPRSDHASILFFSTQKCASTFLSQVLRRVADEQGLIPINYESYLYSLDNRLHLLDDDGFKKTAFQEKGFYYGALRRFVDINKLENYQSVLVLRDPRDVLTSTYYSILYSHTIMNKEIYYQRKVAKKQTIDEYVLDRLPFVKTAFQGYADNLEKNPSILYLKYEDMITEFKPWLTKMFAHLGLASDSKLFKEIIEETTFETQKKKDIYSHKRNVSSGEHKIKLKAETIAVLNKELGSILSTLNYEI